MGGGFPQHKPDLIVRHGDEFFAALKIHGDAHFINLHDGHAIDRVFDMEADVAVDVGAGIGFAGEDEGDFERGERLEFDDRGIGGDGCGFGRTRRGCLWDKDGGVIGI